ncbi:MAG TPA: response regulator [Bryobacteraceae bacterium]|nr:response regulator [Bryobacteraceae bacterium]
MPSVLLIDDDRDYREVLRIFLETRNYQVFEAANGKEGLRALEKNPVDLVITDILMPEQEGLETIQAIRRDRPEQKIIAMSASEALILRMAQRLGANATYSKSESLHQLAEMIAKI